MPVEGLFTNLITVLLADSWVRGYVEITMSLSPSRVHEVGGSESQRTLDRISSSTEFGEQQPVDLPRQLKGMEQ